jgi:hypothetical protein
MSRIRVGWLVIALLVTGSSCSDKKSTPSGILSREEMQNVLWDMIQADQYSAYLAKDSARVNLKMENLRLYEQVFQLHHLTREEFSKSYKYYMDHPDLTQPLFDSLLIMGNRLRTESYSHPVTRSGSTSPAAPPTPPPAPVQPAAKRPFALPVQPIKPPLQHPSSGPKKKLPAP